MATRIVDQFELIEIQIQASACRHCGICSRTLSTAAVSRVFEFAPVDEPRKRIVAQPLGSVTRGAGANSLLMS